MVDIAIGKAIITGVYGWAGQMSEVNRKIGVMPRLVLLLSLLASLAVPSSGDAALAVFVDGRVLKIEDAVLEGSTIALTLPGGGHLVVPATRIDRVVADEFEEPEAVVDPPEFTGCAASWVDDPLPEDLPFAQLIRRTAEDHDIHPRLLAALVRAESNFDPLAVSRAGAMGLTQLMPAAAQDHAVIDVFDPSENLRGGGAHLRRQLDRFGSLPEALAAYNAGATTVTRYDGIPPYRETRTYVRRILAEFCGS
jgi:hypothetical protein